MEKYYQYIKNEKLQQYKYLEQLQKYLDDLTKTQQLANHEFKHAKRDQIEILQEMGKIKKELDKFTG